MTSLRHRILLFIRLCNDLDATVTLANILDYIPYNNANSVAVALNWLKHQDYIFTFGKPGMLRYIISSKGLKLLKVRENKRQIAEMEKALLKIGGLD